VILYDASESGNCYKVRLLCALLGLRLERRAVSVTDRSDRAAILGHLNPALRVPVLILADGRPLAESNAILLFLAEGTPFLPEDRYQRALVAQWLFFEQYQHEPNIAVARFWRHHPDQAGTARERQTRVAAGHAALDAMEAWLTTHRYLVAERHTVADIALYAYTHVAGEGGFDLGRYPAVTAWLDRVRGHDGHIPIDA
jgi:glutathione S-transferase